MDFLVKIEPAHDLTFFCFFFLPDAFLLSVRDIVSSETCLRPVLPVSFARLESLSVNSDKLEPSSRALVGELVPAKGSRPKNDHLLGVFVGLEFAEDPEMPWGRLASKGIELRRRGDKGSPLSTWRLGVLSSTAPAVLGRESFIVRELGEPIRIACSRSPIARFVETIDDILPETLWLGRTVIVLDVSVETKESGRGMNSSVSENPTRPRAAVFGDGLGVGVDWLCVS